jgi:predicted nuclease of predicted toxin-antitoxin system
LRLLVNENLPRQAVDLLRSQGHDVVWVRDRGPGLGDEAVLQLAQTERRLLVTMDRDFATLAFRRGLPADGGVVLIRLPAEGPTVLAQRVAAAMARRGAWQGHFITVEFDRIRVRALPRREP